jgi:hypothetical protein
MTITTLTSREFNQDIGRAKRAATRTRNTQKIDGPERCRGVPSSGYVSDSSPWSPTVQSATATA